MFRVEKMQQQLRTGSDRLSDLENSVKVKSSDLTDSNLKLSQVSAPFVFLFLFFCILIFSNEHDIQKTFLIHFFYYYFQCTQEKEDLEKLVEKKNSAMNRDKHNQEEEVKTWHN